MPFIQVEEEASISQKDILMGRHYKVSEQEFNNAYEKIKNYILNGVSIREACDMVGITSAMFYNRSSDFQRREILILKTFSTSYKIPLDGDPTRYWKFGGQRRKQNY